MIPCGVCLAGYLLYDKFLLKIVSNELPNSDAENPNEKRLSANETRILEYPSKCHIKTLHSTIFSVTGVAYSCTLAPGAIAGVRGSNSRMVSSSALLLHGPIYVKGNV